jgi:hypothetical protein
MLDAGQSCQETMLSGDDAFWTRLRNSSQVSKPRTASPCCHTEKGGNSERRWPALNHRRCGNGKNGSSCRRLLEVPVSAVSAGDRQYATPAATCVGFISRTSVGKVDLKRSGQIGAIYRRDKIRQGVEIRDLPLPLPAPAGAEWTAAYRRWRRGFRVSENQYYDFRANRPGLTK